MMFNNSAKYCYRAIATFFKHVTDMPPSAELQKHKPLLLLQTSDLTPGETVPSPVAQSAEDNSPPPSAPIRATRFRAWHQPSVEAVRSFRDLPRELLLVVRVTSSRKTSLPETQSYITEDGQRRNTQSTTIAAP